MAIVGGGLSGLSAAYELSRTAEQREQFEITVYQMGFRLGGKLASGRNPRAAMRNEEHGLHVWFGFYDNAFRVAREVLEAWKRPDGCPIQNLSDLVSPCSYAPFGRPNGDECGTWTVLFPRVPGEPGTPREIGPAATVLHIVDAIQKRIRMFLADVTGKPALATETVDRLWALPLGPAGRLAIVVDRWAKRAIGAARKLSGSGPRAAQADILFRAARTLQKRVVPALERLCSGDISRTHLLHPVEIVAAIFRGLFDPRFGIFEDWNLDRINHLELRDFLGQMGVSERALGTDSFIQGCYDAFFQNEGGDPNRPNFEAGTAIRVFLRANFLYRGAAFWLLNTGMGEGFIAPLYKVLCERGVRFVFFHECVGVHPAANGGEIERIEFIEQARPRGEYAPTYVHKGLECWPVEPLYDQLQGGHSLAKERQDFEAPTLKRSRAPRVELFAGRDFHKLVLALPIGALTDRAGAPSAIAPLFPQSPKLEALVQGLNLVPSVAAQIWLQRKPYLGWAGKRPAMLSWSYPYPIWAEMEPTIAHEDWPEDSRPTSTLYLCGTIASNVAVARHRDTTRAAEQQAAVEGLRQQLQRHGAQLFEGLRDAQGQFDFSRLVHTQGASADPVAAQYIRVNNMPTDLCDGSAVGTSRLRLAAHESGYSNLVLCGTWARTGINATCVEAAIMAGTAAARAIDSSVRSAFGEHFMQQPPLGAKLPARDSEFEP